MSRLLIGSRFCRHVGRRAGRHFFPHHALGIFVGTGSCLDQAVEAASEIDGKLFPASPTPSVISVIRMVATLNWPTVTCLLNVPGFTGGEGGGATISN